MSVTSKAIRGIAVYLFIQNDPSADASYGIKREYLVDKQIRLKVLGITYSQIQSGAYALVLAQEDGMRRIPIIIGTSEAQAIAIKLEHLTPPRPLTHDLTVSIMSTFGISLKEVFIYRFEDGVFSSELVLVDADGIERRVDSRTSDAIALALRTGAEVYTTEDILARAGVEFDAEHEGPAAPPQTAPQAPPQAPPQSKPAQTAELQNRIAEARARLDRATEAEEYEEASRLRDEIKRLTEQLDQQRKSE